MLFVLGYLSGLITATLVVVAIAFFKKPIEQITNVMGKHIERVAPRQRGYVYTPSDDADADDIREDVIRQNAERGADTPISELQ